MITENVPILKINKLTEAQYERELAAGNIDPTALYLTPDEEVNFPVDSVNGKTGAVTLTLADLGIEIVDEVPAAGNAGKLYLVKA